jgi:hypothetical protein
MKSHREETMNYGHEQKHFLTWEPVKCFGIWDFYNGLSKTLGLPGAGGSRL